MLWAPMWVITVTVTAQHSCTEDLQATQGREERYLIGAAQRASPISGTRIAWKVLVPPLI